MSIAQLLAVARGDAPADLVLRNGRIVNVFSGEIEEADIAIYGEKIAGLGTGYRGQVEEDLAGNYVAPGLIDAHVHIESSLCVPAQFASAIVPRGVTCAVVDPHEIANVAGLAGIHFIAESSRQLPLHVVVMAPSCVPATSMGSNGARLEAGDLAQLLAEEVVYGLAEVMNYPGVVSADPAVLAKLAAFQGRPQDGHAPGLSGRLLSAYAAAGIGSEHECTTVGEAAEKLARGLYIFIREATNARNLHTLLPLVTLQNSRRICFCTDDRQPADLLEQGSIDYMVREAIAYGIDPVTAFRMATLNSAERFGLVGRGAIAPGRVADLVIFDDLQSPHARQVFTSGRLVAEGERMRSDVAVPGQPIPPRLRSTVRIHWDGVDFRILPRGRRMRVIGLRENQLVTEERLLEAKIEGGEVVADVDQDILKIAVIERHGATGSMGLGFVQGFGLQRGAIAGTVVHDHHNLVVVGVDDGAMRMAVQAVEKMGGGLAAVVDGGVAASLPLPVAGLMTDRPIGEVKDTYAALLTATARLGSPLHDPFMAMSFTALEVIPKLKLTDQGLVDVEKFDFVDLFV